MHNDSSEKAASFPWLRLGIQALLLAVLFLLLLLAGTVDVILRSFSAETQSKEYENG